MSADCSGNCSTCGKSCSDRTAESLLEPMNASSSVGKVIGVVSGKGGVGKSLVTGMLAVNMSRLDKKVGILDADITGPSVPKMFGIKKLAEGNNMGIYPVESATGIKLMSLNLLVEDETTPVIWRGPVIAGTVKQFWTDVMWGELDYMFIDMPPGTGDVPLTVFQSIPMSGIVIVTSPQDLVSMVVEKAIIMARKMNIPVLGIIENFSYFECPDCGKRHQIFGESKVDDVAKKYGVPVLAKLPIDPKAAKTVDAGMIEMYDCSLVDKAIDAVINA